MVVTDVSTWSCHARIPDLPAHRKNGFGLQQHGPLPCEAWQDGGHVRDHLVTPLYVGGDDTHTYRRCFEDPNIREIPGHRSYILPNFMPFEFCLTSCHSRKTRNLA